MAPEARVALSNRLFEGWVAAIAERVDAAPPLPYIELLRRGFAEVAAGLPEGGARYV